MKVLFLGRSDSPLISYLTSLGEEVVNTDQKITLEFINQHLPDFIISYSYQHIIKQEILDRFDRKAINLHISLLPWNRGADPNFWSFIDRTPKGVSIHYLDKGVDTGDIITQKEILFGESETLRSSYDSLQKEIQSLFICHWHSIKEGSCTSHPQHGSFTVHRAIDKEPLMFLLTSGWDTPVALLESYGKALGSRQS